MKINIENLAYYQVDEIVDLLKAYRENKLEFPGNFYAKDVKLVQLNDPDYAMAFRNDDYEFIVVDNGKLKRWVNLPYDNWEGLYEDAMKEYEDLHDDDKDFLDSIEE